MKGITNVHRVPSNWKDTVCGKFLDEPIFFELLYRPSLLVTLRKTLPKSLLSSISDFVFFEFGKKYVCPFSDMDFGAIVLKLPGELERIVQNIFHKDE